MGRSKNKQLQPPVTKGGSTKKFNLAKVDSKAQPTRPSNTATEPTKKRKRDLKDNNQRPDLDPAVHAPNARNDKANTTANPTKRAKIQQFDQPGFKATKPTPFPITGPADPLALLRPQLRKVLEERFKIEHTHVAGNTTIGAKARAIVKLLHPEAKSNGHGLEKPILVALTSTAKCANKEISVAEIVKRDLVGKGMKLWQYTGLTSRIEAAIVKKKSAGLKVEHGGAPVDMMQDAIDEEEEDAFETMGEVEQDKNTGGKIRAVPILTIWLSHCSIPEMEREYGVQVTFEKD